MGDAIRTGLQRPAARSGVGLRRLSAPLGLGRFLGMVVAVFVALCVASLALPHDPHIRYQSFKGTIFERLGWIYDRLAHDDTPIDVLFVGSSRLARGANAAATTEALAARGRDLSIANISLPAAGLDIRLTKIRDALAEHPEIRLIVFGVVEQLPRDGHQAFGQLGTVGEIVTAPPVINRNLPSDLAGLPYRQMEFWLASRLPEAFGYRAGFDPDLYAGPMPDHRSFNDPDFTPRPAALLRSPAHAEALAAESRRRARSIRPPLLPDALAWAEFGVSRSYVRRIDALAEAAGAELVFLHLPFYRGPAEPFDAEWLRGQGPLWAASFLRNAPENYADAGHASQIGITALVPWLAERIDTALEMP